MPYGLPDSWAAWGAGRLARGMRPKGGRRGGGRRSTKSVIGTYKTVYKWKVTDVKFHEPAMHNFLNGKTTLGKPSELWMHLDIAAARAVAGAKMKVGKKTGALARSIHARHLGNPGGQYIWIGSMRSYALYHHEGTRPHPIRAHAGGLLVFTGKFKNAKSSKYGRNTFSYKKVMTPMVNHPGTRANHYLSTQLKHFRNIGRV
jgi:hypothetical protein